MTILALIPARGGSKSILRKNVRPLAGHPLIAYSIAAALESRRVDRAVVSTDDDEIAQIARSYGAEVPFLRPMELAQDDTPDLPVFRHALRWLEENDGYRPDLVVQLRPTSPLRPPGLVDQGVMALESHPEADSVRAVIVAGQNPYKMWRLSENGMLVPLLTDVGQEAYNAPRQLLPVSYWQTGHLDVLRAATLWEKASLTGTIVMPLLIDPAYAIDIDQGRDHERAAEVLRQGSLDLVRPGRRRRPLPASVEMLILDFDGVLTDNRVWVDGEGREQVAAHRGDGWGLAQLREAGIEVIVLSSESDPVVAARCRKLGLPVLAGVPDKAAALKELWVQKGVDPQRTIYLGNDVNDIACFPLVGCALVVADAHPAAKAAADGILQNRGGRGAVRELTDMLLEHRRGQPS